MFWQLICQYPELHSYSQKLNDVIWIIPQELPWNDQSPTHHPVQTIITRSSDSLKYQTTIEVTKWIVLSFLNNQENVNEGFLDTRAAIRQINYRTLQISDDPNLTHSQWNKAQFKLSHHSNLNHSQKLNSWQGSFPIPLHHNTDKRRRISLGNSHSCDNYDHFFFRYKPQSFIHLPSVTY